MNKTAQKQRIVTASLEAKKRNQAAIDRLTDRVCLSDYVDLAHTSAHGTVWTAALQAALNEHEIVVIPPAKEIYWLDGTVVIPSNRRIEASGAVIRLVPEYPYIMLRNESVRDGTYAPIDTSVRDRNISISGGSWEESCTARGKRRFHADKTSFWGAQTCMLFNNLDGLTMTDVTFSHANSFCVQIGDITDGVFEHFFFISCFADGLHINGNSENLLVRDFRGHVGDDLVALNMYDWLGSSINYGPAKNIFCEDIHSAPDSYAKAMRLQPGIFAYRDGKSVDCSLSDIYIRRVSGIFEYKLYFQSPPYQIGQKPEGEGAGSADRIFFEEIDIRSERPSRYPLRHPETGHFGMFFLNSHIGYLSLEKIRYTTDTPDDPQTHLIAIGPMTWRRPDRKMMETFDPYVSGGVDTLELEDIFVNGVRATDAEGLFYVIAFDDVNRDGFSSGKGELKHLTFNGKAVF